MITKNWLYFSKTQKKIWEKKHEFKMKLKKKKILLALGVSFDNVMFCVQFLFKQQQKYIKCVIFFQPRLRTRYKMCKFVR